MAVTIRTYCPLTFPKGFIPSDPISPPSQQTPDSRVLRDHQGASSHKHYESQSVKKAVRQLCRVRPRLCFGVYSSRTVTIHFPTHPLNTQIIHNAQIFNRPKSGAVKDALVVKVSPVSFCARLWPVTNPHGCCSHYSKRSCRSSWTKN